MTVAGMDEECLRSIQESKTLAGIFQSVVDDCKVSTHWSKLKVCISWLVCTGTHIYKVSYHNTVTYLSLQSLHPAIDDFIVKSTKLENQIRSTSFAFSAFLESFQKIAQKAANTKGIP